KRSLVLNLKHPDAQRIARDLAAQSHIVIENFRPGYMSRFGLSYDELRAVNPSLVYASISGFGQTGPYRDRAGYDHVIQAMSGLMSITGPPESSGYKVGVSVVAVFNGLIALSGILTALRHADSTGQRRGLDLSLIDSQLSAMVNIVSASKTYGD